jgi:hypothetical protein
MYALIRLAGVIGFGMFLSISIPLHAAEDEAASPDPAADEVEQLAQELETEVVLKEESEDEISIDAEGSLRVPEKEAGLRGWSFFGDVRGLGTAFKVDERDGKTEEDTDVLIRARVGANWAFAKDFRLVGRLAASCTSESCKPDNLIAGDSQGSTENTLEFDEAFLHWYQSERFDVALGRLQTKFITKGGVFAKSLDRNDSNNTRITWTDGAHATLKHENGWESHFIVQYNPDDGPAQVLRDPLDFSSDDTRASAFLSFLNEQPVRFLTQRAIDITYFPSALLKDGFVENSRRKDYWGVVARIAGRYPKRSSGRRIRFSGEIGYAPETPTESAVNLAEAEDESADDDTSGFAAAVTLSLIDFFPKHSIGLNLAHTEAGWLLSPQYNKNERLIELRYVWVATNSLTLDARIRGRQELDRLSDAAQRRREVDAFVRLTWRFRKERGAFF